MIKRKLPIGAELDPAGGVHFRIWAPKRKAVRVVLEAGAGSPGTHELTPEADGYFSATVPEASAGSCYRFEVDDEGGRYPDPAARFQPDGPSGSSRVIDSDAFTWTDNAWKGVKIEGQVLYEMHVGTFTKEGSWKAAGEQLEELASVGITVIELMPLADFPGRFGWGYDGVDLFAPTWLYGEPNDLRQFIDRAHSVGIGVILDVVYNHFGPDGNYLAMYSGDYFTDKYINDWGEPINFDGPNSGPVREFFLANVKYWMTEFHLDGLRLDATQQIFDDSKVHILEEITAAVRAHAQGRDTIVIAENEPQDAKLIRPVSDGGYGMDGLWNDDFHHSSVVALTGRNEAYYSDYLGKPQEFISAAKYGYLYQGQRYQWQGARRGTSSLNEKPAAYVTFIQNHDQVANTLRGERADRLGAVGKYKAMTALLLLGPGTPMLFQGQEFAASTPFLFFCDHKAELSKKVREGRGTFLSQFRSLAIPEVQSVIPDPGNPSTFESCKLDFSERQKNAAYYTMHKDLLRLRREDPVFRMQRKRGLDGAVMSDEAFILRYFGDDHGDRLLMVNFGRDLHLDPAPEPLLAPPAGCLWQVMWSSEDPQYHGYGTFPPDSEDNWRFPGYAAVALQSRGGTSRDGTRASRYQGFKKSMSELIRVLPGRELRNFDTDPHLSQEWLVTNGLGGYASGTVVGPLTRRYHGLLIAALPNPLGRMMMLNALSERLRLPNGKVYFNGPRELTGSQVESTMSAQEFRLEAGLPIWTYRVEGITLEKRILLPHRQNTVHVTYKLLEGDGNVRLGLRPAVHFRSHDAFVSTPLSDRFTLTVVDEGYEVCGGGAGVPLLRMHCQPSTAFTFDRKTIPNIHFATEQRRGYEFEGSMWSPGYFRADLLKGHSVTFVASSENWETVRALEVEEAHEREMVRRRALISTAHPEVRFGEPGELVFAADQFLMTPVGRVEDMARAHASGDELRSVIAGYHWFTDWGRDTMISLEGLTLATGRYNQAGWILRTFAHYVRDGLIPNMFPEGEKHGLYHTADASLWFFHALSRYVAMTGDQATLRLVLPKLLEIATNHIEGTRFGIHVDAEDGLLVQGQEGYQLTWMDAKVDDWVVTPRRGKAVEINALWYNALMLLAGWMKEIYGEGSGKLFEEHAAKTRESFNRRFWNAEKGYLYDVVDQEGGGNDPACRPNQVFAISLPNPVLDREHWEQVMDVVTRKLLTPVGLRSLSPDDKDYKSRYDGDLRSRDAAYHQGTVWGWLIGPYLDAWFKLNPGKHAEAKDLLRGFFAHLNEACVGSISEVFDAEEPHTPRACIAQAWSVAEVLRCWAMTSGSPT